MFFLGKKRESVKSSQRISERFRKMSIIHSFVDLVKKEKKLGPGRHTVNDPKKNPPKNGNKISNHPKIILAQSIKEQTRSPIRLVMA